MAEFGGFFNSVSGDRKYKSEDFSNYFKTFMGTGINPTTDNLKVIKKSTTQIGILAGSACIEGYLYLNNLELTKTISSNVTRVDRVVLRLDIINRTLGIVVVNGTATSPPVLVRNSSMYDLSLAKITIKGSVVTVEDERGQSSLCGYMKFMGKDDLQSMWNIFNAEWASKKVLVDTEWLDKKNVFDTWFLNMQGKGLRGSYIQSSTPVGDTAGDIWIQI